MKNCWRSKRSTFKSVYKSLQLAEEKHWYRITCVESCLLFAAVFAILRDSCAILSNAILGLSELLMCKYLDGSGPIMAQESESKKSQTERTGYLVKSNRLQVTWGLCHCDIVTTPNHPSNFKLFVFHRKPIHPPASHLKVESTTWKGQSWCRKRGRRQFLCKLNCVITKTEQDKRSEVSRFHVSRRFI